MTTPTREQYEPPIKGMTKRPFETFGGPGDFIAFIEFAVSQEKIRARFKADTGVDLNSLVRSPIAAMVDKACGYDHRKHVEEVVAKFADWLAENVWGLED